ncbi:MAG: tetratricopeptide repeat protein [Xanthomonadaceae bacterium]|jgi:cytochrome c-type biogenesis protein CcmH|nr:tetratricopeptide repeat protein [Xanthomonadaceae bacterium]
MVAFIIATTLIVICALTWVLKPLWTTSRTASVVLILLMGINTFAIYMMVGTPAALDRNVTATPPEPHSLAEAVEQLQAEMQRNPESAEGWGLLARSYMQLGRLPEAGAAYSKAVQLLPDEPDLLVEAAQARAMSAPQNRFDEAAVAMLRHALEVQPGHQRAAWFIGISQRQRGEAAEAAATWETLLPRLDPKAAEALIVEINHARRDAGLPELTPASAAPAASDASVASMPINISVQLSPALKSSMSPGDTLFVIARQADGSPMPVAVKRLPVGDFPVVVELSDNDGVMPALKLSEMDQFQILARISKSGEAGRASGDLESSPLQAQTKSADTPFQVLIDQKVP